jgi:hypothetical protein
VKQGFPARFRSIESATLRIKLGQCQQRQSSNKVENTAAIRPQRG